MKKLFMTFVTVAVLALSGFVSCSGGDDSDSSAGSLLASPQTVLANIDTNMLSYESSSARSVSVKDFAPENKTGILYNDIQAKWIFVYLKNLSEKCDGLTFNKAINDIATVEEGDETVNFKKLELKKTSTTSVDVYLNFSISDSNGSLPQDVFLISTVTLNDVGTLDSYLYTDSPADLFSYLKTTDSKKEAYEMHGGGNCRIYALSTKAGILEGGIYNKSEGESSEVEGYFYYASDGKGCIKVGDDYQYVTDKKGTTTSTSNGLESAVDKTVDAYSSKISSSSVPNYSSYKTKLNNWK